MQDKLSNFLPPVLFNAGLWLCGITLLLLAKHTVELFTDPVEEGWLDLDLAMALIAYVLLFLLEPARSGINRRLNRRIRRQANSHRS